METNIWKSSNSVRTLLFVQPRRNVFTLTLYTKVAAGRWLTDFSWSKQVGGTQRGASRSFVCWFTVSEIFPWQRRTDLVIDKKLRRHWKEAKGINSWAVRAEGGQEKRVSNTAEGVHARELTSHQSVDQPRVTAAKETKHFSAVHWLVPTRAEGVENEAWKRFSSAGVSDDFLTFSASDRTVRKWPHWCTEDKLSRTNIWMPGEKRTHQVFQRGGTHVNSPVHRRSIKVGVRLDFSGGAKVWKGQIYFASLMRQKEIKFRLFLLTGLNHRSLGHKFNLSKRGSENDTRAYYSTVFLSPSSILFTYHVRLESQFGIWGFLVWGDVFLYTITGNRLERRTHLGFAGFPLQPDVKQLEHFPHLQIEEH